MIKINLLSPSDKDNLKWEKINNLTLQSMFWIFLAEAFFVAAFFFSVEYLKVEKDSVSTQLESLQKQDATKQVNQMNSDLKTYKSKIDEIYSIQSNHPSWSYLLENLALCVPDDVRLEGVNVTAYTPPNKTGQTAGTAQADNPEKYKVDITGKAKTRENLLNFENNLKNDKLVSELSFDDSNYVQASNVSFRYSFYVVKENLLK